MVSELVRWERDKEGNNWYWTTNKGFNSRHSSHVNAIMDENRYERRHARRRETGQHYASTGKGEPSDKDGPVVLGSMALTLIMFALLGNWGIAIAIVITLSWIIVREYLKKP